MSHSYYNQLKEREEQITYIYNGPFTLFKVGGFFYNTKRHITLRDIQSVQLNRRHPVQALSATYPQSTTSSLPRPLPANSASASASTACRLLQPLALLSWRLRRAVYSPSWLRRWERSANLAPKPRPHTRHLKGRSPECLSACSSSSSALANFMAHSPHVKMLAASSITTSDCTKCAWLAASPLPLAPASWFTAAKQSCNTRYAYYENKINTV